MAESSPSVSMLSRCAWGRLAGSPSKIMKFSTSPALRLELCGRDILQPSDLTVQEWKRIIWCAMDLKRLSNNGKESLNLLPGKHVTLLFLKPSGRNLLSCAFGSGMAGANHTFYKDPDFESQPNVMDSGRALAQLTDLFLVNGCNQAVLCKLAEGSASPVIGLSTNMFSIFKTLVFLMTIQERFGYLRRLKAAWIGPSTALCNTILSLFPEFGINIKFCCICAHGTGPTSPVTLESALAASNKGFAEIHQCSSPAEAIYRSHVVIVSSHPDVESQITCKMIEEAELEWMLLHPLPRTEVEVSDTVFADKNNLTWLSSENHLYVAMALMTSVLSKYEPAPPMPGFDGIL